MRGTDKTKPDATEVRDEPGMAERFQRGLQRALSTPPQQRRATTPKPKARSVSKGGCTREKRIV